MKQIITLLIAGTISLFYKPVYAQDGSTSFAKSPTNVQTEQLARFANVKATVNNNKVILQWAVNENETASQFEIEKSNDGKNFTMAALVFGTDKPATDTYQFYEKAGSKKTSYRIKVISKDQKAEYSPVVKIGTAR
jgi:hypothetical protein